MSEGRPDHDDIEQWVAERREREARTARRTRRRERRFYAIGKALLWAASIVFAFEVGYSQDHRLTRAAALTSVWIVIGLLVGGAVLMSSNGEGAQMWTEDPEAAKRWRDDLESERLTR